VKGKCFTGKYVSCTVRITIGFRKRYSERNELLHAWYRNKELQQKMEYHARSRSANVKELEVTPREEKGRALMLKDGLEAGIPQKEDA